MNWQNIVTGSGGLLFSHHYIYQAVGDTVFTAAPTHLTNQTTFWWPLYGLQPATHYIFASVFKQGTNYDTSTYRMFTTDSLPGPPAQFTIAYTGIAASPVGTQVQVHYVSPDYPIGIKLYTDQYSASSAVLTVQGVGDTSIQAPLNTPNSTHTANALYATTVAPIMGISDTFVTVPDYTVPGYTPTDIVSSGLSGVSQDSLRAVFSFARGNAPGATYQLWAYDSTMSTIASVSATGYAQDTTVYVTVHNLTPGTKYYFKARTSSVVGADSSMFSTYTSPVNQPQPNEPQWGTVTGKNESTTTLTNINYSVSVDDTGTLLYRRMQDGSGTWLTFTGPGNLAPTSFTSISFDDNGLLGGTKYYYQIGMRSKSGVEVWNPDLSHWGVTADPLPPVIADTALTFPVPTTVVCRIIGSGRGTLTTLYTQLYVWQNGWEWVSDGPGPVAVGSGDFDQSTTFANLQSYANYRTVSWVTGPNNSNPSPEWIQPFTTGFTAIDEIATDKGALPDTAIVTVTNPIGQVVMRGTSYGQACNALPAGIYLMSPTNEELRMQFGTKKVCLQK